MTVTVVDNLELRRLRLQVERLGVERDQARTTGSRLNRRAQAAESRVLALVRELERAANDLDQLETELGVKLGAALERIRTLEVCLGWLKPDPPALPPAVPDADEGDALAPEELPPAADYCPKNADHRHRDDGGMFFFSCRDCRWKDDDGSIPSV